MASTAETGSSTSAFVSSLIFNLIIFTIFIVLFIQLRPGNKRVYQPRTLEDIKTMKSYEKLSSSEFETDRKSLSSYFSWVPNLLSKPNSFIIQHCSIDGFFFLRYVSLIFFISLIGCFLLLPILLPVNATNGLGLPGFSLLAMSNVTNFKRFYAHIFLSWIYFGFILWVIYREMYYYTTMRHAIQVSPLIQSLVSSKTVFLIDCDMAALDQDLIKKEFENVESVKVAQDFTKLEKNCQERDKISSKLENLLNKQINKAMKKVAKWSKKGKPVDEGLAGKPKEDFQSYTNKRPHHRLKEKWYNKIPLVGGGKKVDSIEHYLTRVDELNKEIAQQQENHETEFEYIGAMFIQFHTQYDAQRCYQTLDYVLEKGSFGQKFIGYAPEDLIWKNVSLNKTVRLGKQKVAATILVLLLIFWAIPVAVVGCISNINFLTDKVHFLSFINNCPPVILGLITGLLPTIMLAVLMMLVPIFIKFIGNKSGLLTYQEIELYCQKWYFAFQVIEVFIVTTMASSASSSVTAIIKKPSSAMTLLSENLPKASNFYIAYFMLLGLTLPSGQLLQLVNLILSKVLGRLLDTTPRQKWNRYNNLSKPSWGVISPVVELFAVLFVCYCIIQPLILLFSTFALGTFYIAYLYTYNYVSGFAEHNLKGRFYLRALFQLFTALYLAEICLIGLFVMGKNWGAVVLESVTLVASAGCHIFYKKRFLALADIVPLSVFNVNKNGEIEVDDHGEAVINMDQYPIDQGYKDLMSLKKQSAIKHKEKEEKDNAEYIKPADDEDLAKANILFKQKSHESYEQEKTQSSSTHLPESTFVEEDTNAQDSDPKNPFKKRTLVDVKNDNADAPNISLNPKLDKLMEHNEQLDLETYPSNGNKLNKAGLLAMCKSFFKPTETFTLVELYKKLPPFYELISYNGEIPDPSKKDFNNDGTGNGRKNSNSDSVTNGVISEDYKAERSSNESGNINPKRSLENIFAGEEGDAYVYPRLNDQEPIIWICKDDMDISTNQITYAKTLGVKIEDSNTAYDEKGKSKYLGSPPDFKL